MENKDRQFTVEPLDLDDQDVRVGLKLMRWPFQANPDGTITFEMSEEYSADDWGEEVEFYDEYDQLTAHLDKKTQMIRFFVE